MSLWGEDICEGPVEGISVETVVGDAVNIVLCCCMMAVLVDFVMAVAQQCGQQPVCWTLWM